MPKLTVMLSLILLALVSLAGGFIIALEFIPPQIEYIHYPVYYLDQERIDRYQGHIELLHGSIEQHEQDLNRLTELNAEQQKELSILRLKVALYKEMTGKEIEVELEPVEDFTEG